MIMKVIINQLLFACKKYLLGLWEPFQSDYFSLRTSSQIDKQSPRTSSVPINSKIKLSWIKVGFQSTIYMYTVITNIYFILNVMCKLTLKALQNTNRDTTKSQGKQSFFESPVEFLTNFCKILRWKLIRT